MSRGRSEPATGSTITAISDGIRAVNMVFLRDGVIDEHEFAAIRVLRNAAGKAAWADWNRRAGQAWENDGGLNGRLEREARELGSQFPPDAA